MATRKRNILIVSLTLVLGLVVGAAAGWYVSIGNVSRFFVDGWMLGKALDVQGQVATLQDIRNVQIEKATESLEARMDENIISLKTNKEYAPQTNIVVTRAIKQAREYRSNYPRHSGNKDIDSYVNGVLQEKSNNVPGSP